MTLKQIIPFVMAAIVLTVQPIAAKDNALSYNLRRACEEAENGNSQSAIEYIEKELSDNSKNGYAYMLVASIYMENSKYGHARSATESALKYLPKKDKETRSDMYLTRGELLAIERDTIGAYADLATAIQLNPSNEEAYETRAKLLFMQGRYDESDADYRTILSLNPGGVAGRMGLGRNFLFRKDYDKAIEQFDVVLTLYPDLSDGYLTRAQAYLLKGDYLNAIDDACKAIEIDSNENALYLISDFPKEQLPLVVTKLKGMAVKNPYDVKWWGLIGLIYTDKKMYTGAIEAFQKAFDIDAYYVFLEMISECYQEIGDYAKALEYVNQALLMNPDDLDLISTKGNILGESGDIDGAIAEWTNYIERSPDSFWGYYRRGFFEDNDNRTDAALEDYNMSIMLQPDYTYAYHGKGDMLMRKGQAEEAMEAYRKVVELDTVPNNYSCAMYALLALGEKDKAVDFMNRVIENDSTDCGNFYNAACIYSLIGDLDKSLSNLRTSFEKGFRRFHHVRNDEDLEALRQTDGFKTLIEEYERKIPNASEDQNTDNPEKSERVEIPFTPDGGCVSVKCSINELPLNFIFDTGASIVSLSQVEANFMLKNGYLKLDDFVGSGSFVDANGDVSEGTIVNLRNVDFGGLKLKNVRASVVRNQKAPLLLGQSVLGRLGSIEIDNSGKKLIITHTR